MSDPVAIIDRSEPGAEDVRLRILKPLDDYPITINDVVIAAG